MSDLINAGNDLTITSTAFPVSVPIAHARRRTDTTAISEKWGLYIIQTPVQHKDMKRKINAYEWKPPCFSPLRWAWGPPLLPPPRRRGEKHQPKQQRNVKDRYCSEALIQTWWNAVNAPVCRKWITAPAWPLAYRNLLQVVRLAWFLLGCSDFRPIARTMTKGFYGKKIAELGIRRMVTNVKWFRKYLRLGGERGLAGRDS